jgi:cell division protease FtsH
VVECTIQEDEIKGRITRKAPDEPSASGQPWPGETFLFRTVRVEDPKLVEELHAAGVKFVGVRPGFLTQFFWAWLLPLGLLLALWLFLQRRLAAGAEQVLSIGRSRAKLIADEHPDVTFADVAGCEEAKHELQEVVDFLKNPDRYRQLGAKIPKGVLLVGPPGTGKTLLARAVAGEAKVPFFSLSGSEFVEMFVGVGAARVRDLFQQAKQHAPCLVFIDELDAIGRQRGVHVGTVNDEREQTLNQLLVELDGFEPNTGVILLAATNRPEVLDRALLRPGRFDRQVVVNAPDLDGRLAILRVHARDKPLAEDVDLRKVAQATPGFSGADLANAMNEAALLAVRRGSRHITQKDLEEAVEKVVAGPERKSRRLNEEEKRRVAYHETGHALVAAFSKYADPVHKISIVPRGRAALGYTMQLPADDQFLLTRAALVDRIKGLLGGRAAEEVVFGEVSTGAENDLERATALARQMVCMYGMSESVGLVHCGQRQSPYYLAAPGEGFQRDCSEETARQIDAEVKGLLDKAYEEARAILAEHRNDLERVAQELLRRETLDGTAFQALLRPVPANADPNGRDGQPAAQSPAPMSV